MPLSPVSDLSFRLDVGGQRFQGLPDGTCVRLDPPSGLAAAAMSSIQHEVDTLGYRGIVEDRHFLAPALEYLDPEVDPTMDFLRAWEACTAGELVRGQEVVRPGDCPCKQAQQSRNYQQRWRKPARFHEFDS